MQQEYLYSCCSAYTDKTDRGLQLFVQPVKDLISLFSGHNHIIISL